MGKVCSKAHGLRYVDDESFIGARLGPEGKCLSSQESLCQSSCSDVVKLKREHVITAGSKYQLKCTEDFKEPIRENFPVCKEGFAACKSTFMEDEDLIVDLPPEGQKEDEKSPSEVEIAVKCEMPDAAPLEKPEEKKTVDNPSKSNQDEWSYTVYDIDGGSKVTDQDLSHVMNSIRTAIDQTVDQSSQGNPKDIKMLKIKVAIGQHENSVIKPEKKIPRGFNRMLLPPPDSEEAELLCYYIREKLLTYANQERNSNGETPKERKRSKRRVQEGCGFNSRSPEVSPVAVRESAHRKSSNSCKESSETKQNTAVTSFSSPTPPSCHSVRTEERVNASHEPLPLRTGHPLYGLPQRQDTYGGPVDTYIDSYNLRSRQSCPTSSGTRSPQVLNDVEHRSWAPDRTHEVAEQQHKANYKHSTFHHKDAYREAKTEQSPRKCKKSDHKGQSSHSKTQSVSGIKGPLQTPPLSGPRERRSDSSRVCPCKYRVTRNSRHRKQRNSSTEKDRVSDPVSTADRNVPQIDKIETGSNDEVFLQNEILSNDGSLSREQVGFNTESKFDHRSREESRSSGETRSNDGMTSLTDSRSDDTENRSIVDPVPHYGFKYREGTVSRDDTVIQRELRQQGRRRSCDEFSTSCKGARSVENSSSESSAGASHSSSWKDHMQFGSDNTRFKFVHEWNYDQDLSTNNMIQSMQEQGGQSSSGCQSPRSQALSIESPQGEVVHRHEHHHYHYHIFKRS